ncbi:MAG: hypothetical protein KF729_11070 [Sandaracinaceae bacterium]|nr:hypothetical protein [Sandaracinaceae bacterium]
MQSRFVLYVVIAGAIALGGVVLYATTARSEEARLERLVDDVLEDPDRAELDWTDPARVPLEVQIGGRRAALSTALGRLRGDDVEVVQRSVNVRGEQADVAMRARVDGELVDLRFRLARDGEDWRIRSVVTR